MCHHIGQRTCSSYLGVQADRLPARLCVGRLWESLVEMRGKTRWTIDSVPIEARLRDALLLQREKTKSVTARDWTPWSQVARDPCGKSGSGP